MLSITLVTVKRELGTVFEEEINFLKTLKTCFCYFQCQHIKKTEMHPSSEQQQKSKNQTLQMTQHAPTQRCTKATLSLPPQTCLPTAASLPSTQVPKAGPRYHPELFLFLNPYHQSFTKPSGFCQRLRIHHFA